jgi:hypothetical protein
MSWSAQVWDTASGALTQALQARTHPAQPRVLRCKMSHSTSVPGARALTPGCPARQLGSGVCAVAFGRDGQTAARREAVGMALHARLGAASPLGELDPGVVREIMDAL